MSIVSSLKKWIKPLIKREPQPEKVISPQEFVMKGYQTFLQTGETPPEYYYALRNLYYATNGSFHEALQEEIKLMHPPLKVVEDLNGVAGHFSSSGFNSVNTELNKNGYFHFDRLLGKELCERLWDFALKTPAEIPS